MNSNICRILLPLKEKASEIPKENHEIPVKAGDSVDRMSI
jgi:hypothetical protein